MARKVVLAGACRTAIGVMGGQFANTSAVELGTIVIKEALKERAFLRIRLTKCIWEMLSRLATDRTRHVRQLYMQESRMKYRQQLSTYFVDPVFTVNLAAKLIAAGDADIIVAGGMENMTMAPYMLRNGRYGYRMGNATIEDAMIKDGLTDAFHNYHMGITAENICEQWGLTREELDEFAAWSQNKCEKAMAEGKFKDEIVPVEVKKKKETILVDTDEGPRKGITKKVLQNFVLHLRKTVWLQQVTHPESMMVQLHLSL